MQVAPPATRFGKRVVDKNTVARPNARHKQLAVAAPLKVVLLESLFKNEIAIGSRGSSWLMFHSGIDNRHEFDSLPAEPFCECFWIRKTLRVEREDAIADHVIDVEMDHVKRQIAFAILARNFLDHRIGVITPAALLIAERPHRRQRHMACQIRVAAQDLLDRWSIKEVVVQFSTLSAEPGALLRRSAKIEIAAIAVVEKDPVGDPALQADIKRDRLIDGIFTLGVAGRIGVPVDEETATFVESRCFFAEAVEVFVEAELFGDSDERSRFWIKHHARELAFGIVGHWPFVRVDRLVRTRVAKLDQ